MTRCQERVARVWVREWQKAPTPLHLIIPTKITEAIE